MKTRMMEDLFKMGALSAIIAIGLPDMAMAQETFVGLSTRLGQTELRAFPYLLSAVCYVGGAFMMVSGALSLKKHAENPAGEPMAKGIARLLTGGALTAVPTLTGLIQNSLFQDSSEATFKTFTQTF